MATFAMQICQAKTHPPRDYFADIPALQALSADALQARAAGDLDTFFRLSKQYAMQTADFALAYADDMLLRLTTGGVAAMLMATDADAMSMYDFVGGTPLLVGVALGVAGAWLASAIVTWACRSWRRSALLLAVIAVVTFIAAGCGEVLP